MKQAMIVSACLLGENCRYDGKDNKNALAIGFSSRYTLIPVCPEVLGGLSTPRVPCEIVGGRGYEVLEGRACVKSSEGVDYTKEYIKGAKKALAIAKENDVTVAALKSKSPSCGFGKIYNGEFCKTLVNGNGVLAQLLLKEGIKIISCD